MRLQIQREFCHPTYFLVSYNDCRFYAFDGRFIVDELNTLLKEYFKILNMVGETFYLVSSSKIMFLLSSLDHHKIWKQV